MPHCGPRERRPGVPVWVVVAHRLLALGLLLALIVVAPAAAAAGHLRPLRVHFIDVGQGDSILVETPAGDDMLIDAGPTDHTQSLLAYLRAAGVKKLTLVIATHPHEDHIGGMAGVLDAFPTSVFAMPKKPYTTATYASMVAAAKGVGKRVVLKAGAVLTLPGVDLQVLAPRSDSYEDLNDFSGVIKLTYGATSFLLTGDASAVSEGEMLAAGADLPATVLKVGHHGSRTASSAKFLRAVHPEFAVISCGTGNDYGHPHPETLEKLAEIHSTVFRTDTQGTIVAESDGKTVSLKTSKTPANQTLKGLERSSVTATPGGDVGQHASADLTVYITTTGRKYHRAGCQFLARSQIPILLTRAKAQGYTPCSICTPPR